MSNTIPVKNADDYCKKIKANGKTQYFVAGGGLRLRVSPTGGKSWVLGYKLKIAETHTVKAGDNYVSRSLSLGAFKQNDGSPAEALTVKQAKDEAADIKSALKKGKDPIAERRATEKQRIADDAARMTVREVYHDWLEVEICKRKDGGAEVKRMMEKDALPVIGNLDIKDINKTHLVKINHQIKKRSTGRDGGERIAKVVYDLCRQLIEYAIHCGFIEPSQNPCIGVDKKRIGSTGKIRERYLEEDEVRELFAKLPASGLVGMHQLAVPIQLATSVRIGELLTARWEHFDLDEKVWSIPETKNGKAHTVYLSSFAIDYIERLRELTGRYQWLFPSSRSDSHVDEKSLTKQVADRQREDGQVIKGRSVRDSKALMLSGGQWRPHDLRRTAATMMEGLHIMPMVIEKTLNHSEGSKVERTYKRYDYAREMREAWELLGQRLAILSNPDASNVTFLRNKSA